MQTNPEFVGHKIMKCIDRYLQLQDYLHFQPYEEEGTCGVAHFEGGKIP